MTRIPPLHAPVPIALILAGSLVGSLAAAAEPERFDLGATPTAAEIERVDVDVMPDGRGLPPGAGSVAEGEALFARACAQCHGAQAVGGPNGSLAGEPLYDPAELAADRALKHTVGNYWPYATTLFDYVRRAMPYDRPGSLGDDEVYALTAYLLYRNGLIDEGTQMNRETLSGVEMPARKYFAPAYAAGEGS